MESLRTLIVHASEISPRRALDEGPGCLRRTPAVAAMASHSSSLTTLLYNRRPDRVSLDESE